VHAETYYSICTNLTVHLARDINIRLVLSALCTLCMYVCMHYYVLYRNAMIGILWNRKGRHLTELGWAGGGGWAQRTFLRVSAPKKRVRRAHGRVTQPIPIGLLIEIQKRKYHGNCISRSFTKLLSTFFPEQLCHFFISFDV
jgi:hypothetical protein